MTQVKRSEFTGHASVSNAVLDDVQYLADNDAVILDVEYILHEHGLDRNDYPELYNLLKEAETMGICELILHP